MQMGHYEAWSLLDPKYIDYAHMQVCIYAHCTITVYVTHSNELVGFESPSSVYTDGFQISIQTAVREAGALGLGAIRPSAPPLLLLQLMLFGELIAPHFENLEN